MSQHTGSVPDTLRAPDWRDTAACRADNVDPDTFFHDNNAAYIADARAICKTCPVQRACLVACLRDEGGRGSDSRFGVYAGLTPRQRHRLYQQIRASGRHL